MIIGVTHDQDGSVIQRLSVSAQPSMTPKPLEVSFKLYGTLLISCAGDGSCEAFHPPPSASINPPLAVIC